MNGANNMDKKIKRLFVLGAGFSKPAGLPLGEELLAEIIDYVRNSDQIFHEHGGYFNQAIHEYEEYSQKEINEANIEEFIEFFDYRHFLGFRGILEGDSIYGGGIQSIIRVLISTVLSEKQKNIRNKKLYEEFVKQLSPDDIIISLNYDNLVEIFLDWKCRLFPPYLCKEELNSQHDQEVTLLKVHGSINWFNYRELLERVNQDQKKGSFHYGLTTDFIFNNQHDVVNLNPFIPWGFKPEIQTSLKDIYWVSVSDLDRYIKAYNSPLERTSSKSLPPAITHPVILSPSYAKLLYSQSIKDLFYGASFYGRDIDKIIIIGCSLTKYDRYIRQWLFDILLQYYGMSMTRKNILIISNANHCSKKRELKENYSFLGKERMDVDFGGFTEKSLSKIFN